MIQKNKGNELLTFLGLLQASAAVLLVCSCLAVISNVSYPTELLSHFRLQYFLVGTLLGFYFLLIRNKNWFLAMLSVSLLNAGFILPLYLGRDSGQHNQPANSLKIVLCNVNTQNANYDGVMKLAWGENPDLLVLQEVSDQWMRALVPLTENYSCVISRPRSDNFGIAVFSRISGLKAQDVSLGVMDLPSVKVNFSWSGCSWTLMTTHPLPPINSQFYLWRNLQLEKAAKEIAELKGNILLLGDLNMTMWSGEFTKVERISGLRNGRRGFGILASWPAGLGVFGIPLDHCLVSSEIRVLDIRTGSPVGSDHLPLIVQISL